MVVIRSCHSDILNWSFTAKTWPNFFALSRPCCPVSACGQCPACVLFWSLGTVIFVIPYCLVCYVLSGKLFQSLAFLACSTNYPYIYSQLKHYQTLQKFQQRCNFSSYP
jgi:hypothetical protein